MQFLSTDILYAGVRLDFDLTTLAILVIFAVLHQVLKAKVFKPFLADAALRDDATATRRQEAGDLQHKADALHEQHQKIVADAKAEAQEARRSLRLEGLQQKEASLQAAQEKSQADYTQASTELNAKFEATYAEAMSHVDSIATEMAAKLLGRKI